MVGAGGYRYRVVPVVSSPQWRIGRAGSGMDHGAYNGLALRRPSAACRSYRIRAHYF
jgi:hypothetical protein